MVGGNRCHLLGVTDKILTHTEIKHYTNVGIHNDYTLAITVIGTIRFYRTEYNGPEGHPNNLPQPAWHLMELFFQSDLS